jgi:hypothetical protein
MGARDGQSISTKSVTMQQRDLGVRRQSSEFYERRSRRFGWSGATGRNTAM